MASRPSPTSHLSIQQPREWSGTDWVLLGSYTNPCRFFREDSSMMKEIGKHLYFQFLPAPPLYRRPPGTRQSPLCSFICPEYNYIELGHSYLAGRVLRVMAKLPSWHCLIKTYSCMPILENQSSTLQGCMDVPIQPRQQQRRQIQEPRSVHSASCAGHRSSSLGSAGDGISAHPSPQHFQARSSNCRAGVMITNKYKAGIS